MLRASRTAAFAFGRWWRAQQTRWSQPHHHQSIISPCYRGIHSSVSLLADHENKSKTEQEKQSNQQQEEKNQEEGGAGFGSKISQWFEQVQKENPELKQSVEELKKTEFMDESTKQVTQSLKQRMEEAKESWKTTSEGLKDHTGKMKETVESTTKTGQEKARKAQETASSTWGKLNEKFKGSRGKSGDEEPSSSKEEKKDRKTQDQPKHNSKISQLSESFKDVMAGVFGIKRASPKDKSQEEEEYPWVEYEDPDTGKVLYRNQNTGVIFKEKPFDFDERAKPENKIQMNTQQDALTIVPEKKTRWQQYSERLMQQPIMQQLQEFADEVAESEVGQRAREIKENVADRKERIREKWETSQHPLVYNATYAYDRLFSESEQGRAMNKLLMIDPGFDEVAFLDEVGNTIVPEAVDAFLRGDRKTMQGLTTDEAMQHINAVFKARESEGLVQDPTVLSISRLDVVTARHEEGKPPIMVVSAMVQQINCMRNKKGEVVEGNEDEIRAVVYLFALQRDYSTKTGELEWRIAEMSMQGSILYL